MKVISAGGTHVGKVRTNNEDNFYINGYYKEDADQPVKAAEDDKKRSRYLYAVCDGMGGRKQGEQAALTALSTLQIRTNKSFSAAMGQYVEEANQKICRKITESGQRMGTTLAVLEVERGKAKICNVGDSRIYRMRGSELVQLSKDHTRVQQMVDSGILDKNAARQSKERHVLTQHLGIFPEEFILDPFIVESVSAKKGDMFLLCSDGLTDMMEDVEIGQCMLKWREYPPKYVVNYLILEALGKGGKDNISAVVVKIV